MAALPQLSCHIRLSPNSPGIYLFYFWILILQHITLVDMLFHNTSIIVISPALNTARETLLQQLCHCSPHIGLTMNFTGIKVSLLCFISTSGIMVIINCPYPGCAFNTGNVAEALAAMLLQIHASGFHSGGTPDVDQSNVTTITVVACVRKVWCPTISAGSSTEAWCYFNIRWTDYVTATKITGQDHVIRLLECCDEDLGKNLISPHNENRGRSIGSN